MNIADEFYAVVDQDGVRSGGYTNKWKLFETEARAERGKSCANRKEDTLQEHYPRNPKRKFTVVKLTFKVVADEKI